MMPLPLIPDNQEILALVAAHVEGPYRVVHHAWIPYVRVAPAGAEPIRVRASEWVHPGGSGIPVTVAGRDAAIDFAILFRGTRVALQALGRRATILDSIDPAHELSHRPPRGRGVPKPLEGPSPMAREVPEGGEPRRRAHRAQKPVPQLIVADPAPRVVIPDDVSPYWQQMAEREGLMPSEGDYLVLPEGDTTHQTPYPPWVAQTPHVEHGWVVQPRLGVNRPLAP